MSFEPPDPLKLFESIRKIIDAIVSFVRANQWSNLLILIGTLLALIPIIARVLFEQLIITSLFEDYLGFFLVIELLIFITAIALKLFNLDRPLSPRLRRILLLLMSGTVLIYLIAGLIFQHLIAGLIFQPSTTQFKCPDGNEYCFSWGERVLITQDSLEEATRKESCRNNFNLKENGTQSYGKNSQEDFEKAEAQFRQYTDEQKCSNDPEAHIYLNNAKAQMSEKTPIIRIAVSVPISRSNYKGVSEAQETLRGIALAQYKVNDENNGIDGRKLIVGIADDGFNPQETAKFLVERQNQILGVIGHSTSTATKDAGKIYNEKGVVAISPSSTAVGDLQSSGNDLTASDYVFRTASNDSIAVKQLVKYISNHTKIKKIAIVHDDDTYSNSYKNVFEDEFKSQGNGSKVINESNKESDKYCDLSDNNFDDGYCLEKVGQQAEALLLAPSSPRAESRPVLSILKKATVPLFGADSMYNLEVVKALDDANKSIIVAVPWHRRDPWFPLQKTANDYFRQHTINWNTAMAYDATLTLAKGLQEASEICSVWDKKLTNLFDTDSCLRSELKNVLSNPKFSVGESVDDNVYESAVEGGVIQFDKFGDRCAEETEKKAREGGYCKDSRNKIGSLVEAKNGNFSALIYQIKNSKKRMDFKLN
ncbi:amino acid ABC transporter substrate-binding protein [Chroococcidiopsidales cyanobacterium LEGE 13417]|nr:amino acid ABC transporter substrate-binding protein [Chroococcidiopsidales cyanobacterium LEGE 13417]